MVINFLRQKWKRILLIIIGAVVAFVLIGALILNWYWSPILASKLKSTILTSTDSLYKIDFTDAELHVLQGKIVIYNLDFRPDTAVYHQKLKLHEAPNNLYNIHIAKLVLTHVHPFRLYFKRKLDIGQIILSSPELHISYRLVNTSDTSNAGHKTIYQGISKVLQSIHVNSILLNDVQFKYEDHSGNKVAISELKELNLAATDLLIDSATQTDKSRFYFCKDVTAEINNFSGKTMNGLYQYKMKLLKLSTSTSQLNAGQIDIRPADTNVFFRKSANERYALHLDSMQLNNFDFLSYHKFRKLTASSMRLSNGSFSIFGNPKPGGDTTSDKAHTFPNAAIYELNTDLKIDTIDIKAMRLNLTEFGKKSHKTGTIVFNYTSGRFLNVCTDSASLSKNNICKIKIATYLMSKARLDVDFAFNLTDKNLPFSYKGTVGPMNFPILNSAVMPLAMVKVSSGKLQSFDFDIQGDRLQTHGKVNFLYNNLKVTLLKMDSVDQKYKHLTLASFFANAMIIKHNNPDNNSTPARSFYVNYKRPVNSAFFKTIWKTLLIGIKSCAGFGEQKEKEVKSQMAVRAVEKKERQVKKAERKEKRAAKKLQKALKKQQEELDKQLENQ